MKVSLAVVSFAALLRGLSAAEEVKQQVVVKVQAPAQPDRLKKPFGCPGPSNGSERDGNGIPSDEKYLHSWENGKRPPLSTLKMVCKDLSDLKTGDFVFITVQGKEEVYELAGTDFGKEGSVYKVERTGDTFAFKHPSTSGFLFFNSPSYYVGVKKDSDSLDMFQAYDSTETSFKLCYHEKLNGFVMKNATNDKCLTVCEKLFGHSPCFRKDQCAAVRIYKIPAYCLQRQKTLESKANNKGTKKEQLEKIKQKEALVNTAKASGRGQSTATAGQIPGQVASDQPTGPPGKFVPVREVRVHKKIIVHRKLPRDKKVPAPAIDAASSSAKSCTVSLTSSASSLPSKTSTLCTFSAQPCTCSVVQTTSIPIATTSTSIVQVFVTPKPVVHFSSSVIKTTVTHVRYSTQTIPTTITQVVTTTSKVRVTVTEKVTVTSSKTTSVTVTAPASSEATITTSMTVTTVYPIQTEAIASVESSSVVETLTSPTLESSTLYPTVTCYTTETIDTYV